MPRRRADGYVMISVIAERYNIHPQTLRLYEREGLIKPARTAGNTRLYGHDEIRKLEMILALTRDLGVNLAGVEVILGVQNALEDAREALDLVPCLFEVLRNHAALRLLKAIRAASQCFSHSRNTIRNLTLLIIEQRLGG